MNGSFTDYQVEKWLTQNKVYWLSLHFAAPDVNGNYASEVFGGSYMRHKMTMTEADNRAVYSSHDVTWTALPYVTITHIGGWDAQYDGNLLWWARLDDPVMVMEGKGFTMQAGILALSMS